MATDPDELMLEEAERRADPRRVGDTLERIEWRLQYGEYGGLLGIKLIGGIIVVLLALILWRLW